ncbi:MAG: MATE family efflux transporter [Verrucomicrobiae bacterium]|nr:MATE family efflux transporter [Verrucomicrobiae bacterium]
MHHLSWISIRNEGRSTLLLAFPLIAGQVGQMLMGVADTLMIGRLGVVPLAAATFANNVLHLPLMIGIGMMMAVSIRVSQARGAKDQAAARDALRHGLLIGHIVGIMAVALAVVLLPFLGHFRQDPDVTEAAGLYFLIVSVSMIPAIGAMAVKNHADAMNHPWPAFWIVLGGVALNVLLNWILIYGRFGIPAYGLEGAGIATLIARSVALAALLWWCVGSRHLCGWVPVHWFRRPDWTAVRSLVRVGLPASLQLLAEISAFVGATILIGTLGKEALASHQVAITCAAMVFMVPLGLAMALTVQIGEAWGAGELKRMRPIVVSGWLMVIAFTVLSANVFLFFNRSIAGWFLTESDALQLAASLLVVAAVFQFSDALQIVSAGALRGLDDVKGPAWVAFFAYWVISLPIGWWLAFRQEWGVAGMWWGITIGLTLTALILGVRIWRKTAVSA